MHFLLDVDGTLVDTNYHHTLAWYRAFVQNEVFPSAWRIHRHQGMGGDQLVEAVAGREIEETKGDDIRGAEKILFAQFLVEVHPMPGAAELIAAIKEAGHTIVLASSARADEVEHYVGLIGSPEGITARIDGSQVDRTKPHPDLILTAMESIGVSQKDDVVMVGDSVWDCRAAQEAKIASYGLLTGGFSIEELRSSGAAEVFEDLGALTEHIESKAD
jgi:HAD superfamily hydrolase (TIGR01509 family)